MTERVHVYLDHAATTPIDPRVLDAMLPTLREAYGNASSPHALGREAADAVEEARGHLALALGADPREVVFTSGATEANNLAIKGACRAEAHARQPARIVTCVTEHHAVLDPIASLEEDGFEVVRLGVDAAGHVDLERLESELAKGVRLVSLMSANNETGVRHPLEAIGALCRERDALFHTDATQSFGKEPLDVDAASIDLLSVSAHKLYGPKGVGALFLRRKRPRVRVAEQMEGGGHEAGRRSGTLNVPGIVGLGAAVRIAERVREAERERVSGLRDAFETRLVERTGGAVQRNGDPASRLPGHANLSFEGVDGAELLARIPEVCASTAAACTSASLQRSHVLRAMGLSPERVAGSVRFSLGRTTTEADVDRAVELLVRALVRA
ncbi:MAG: cysteine desulfurase family protein [Planctomycetota bacterium]